MEQATVELASGLPMRFHIGNEDMLEAFDNVISSLSLVSSPGERPRFGDLSGVLGNQPAVQIAAEAAGAAAQAASAGLPTTARVATALGKITSRAANMAPLLFSKRACLRILVARANVANAAPGADSVRGGALDVPGAWGPAIHGRPGGTERARPPAPENPTL